MHRKIQYTPTKGLTNKHQRQLTVYIYSYLELHLHFQMSRDTRTWCLDNQVCAAVYSLTYDADADVDAGQWGVCPIVSIKLM